MRRKVTAEVVVCDRIGCGATWVEHGKAYDRRTDVDRIPVPCGKLGADFCSPSCHRDAHRDEAHGERWRIRRAPPRAITTTGRPPRRRRGAYARP